jgi:pimeloyl-ACP methyl ester carboxylesterase
MVSLFTAAHRGGSGTPLVLLHGFTDTWRTWELVLGSLERRHDVLAPTLAGHAGGPPLPASEITSATVNYQHIPSELLAHQLRGVVACTGLDTLVSLALDVGYPLDAAAIECPVRIIWGTADALLPWPSAATRFEHDLLPHADWIVLDDIGHCPQLDTPTETAALITDFTGR